MFQASAPSPRILVVSGRAPAAATWSQTLQEAGCAASPCAPGDAPTAGYTADAALVLADALEPTLVQALRKAAKARAFPILGSCDGNDPVLDSLDDRLPEQLLANVAAPRIRAAFRAALIEEEVHTRGNLFGLESSPGEPGAADGAQPRLLFVGHPNAAYLAIEDALQASGVAIESTPFSGSALDYARMSAVDLILADGSEASDEALQFCLGLRADAALNGAPGVLLAPENFDRVSYAMTRGVSEIISAASSPADIARRLVRVIERKRRQDSMRDFFRRQMITMPCDPETGLFDSAILAKRLQQHVIVAEASGRPLSAAILRLQGGAAGDAAAQKAARGIAAMLGRILRFEDTAGALDWRTFAVLLPASIQAHARSAVVRFKTALDTGVLAPERAAYAHLDVVGSATQFRPGETAGAFLLRAAAHEAFI